MSLTMSRAPAMREPLGEPRAHVSETLDEHGAPLELVRAEDMRDTGAKSVEDADGCRRTWIPEPPFSALRQHTCVVRSPMTSMSSTVVFTSGPVWYVPPSESTSSP